MQMEGQMNLFVDGLGVRGGSAAGGEVAIRPYDPEEVDGLAGSLANGARFTLHGGVTMQQLDDLAIWITPRSAYP